MRPFRSFVGQMLVRMTHDPFLAQLRDFVISAIACPLALSLMVSECVRVQHTST